MAENPMRRRTASWLRTTATFVSWRRHGRLGLALASFTGLGALTFWLQAGTGEAADFCERVANTGRHLMPIDLLTANPASCEPIWSLLLLGLTYYSLAAFPVWMAAFSTFGALRRAAPSKYWPRGAPVAAKTDPPLFSVCFVAVGVVALVLIFAYMAAIRRFPFIETVAIFSLWGAIALTAPVIRRCVDALGLWSRRRL